MRQIETTVAVPVPTTTFLALYEFIKGSGSAVDPVRAVEAAIEYWIDNADWKPDLIDSLEPKGGFRWKSLLLPPGTQLRMRYKGEYHYASVDGDDFVAGDRKTTPGAFVNEVSQSSRSAWRDLEVKRPADVHWIPAQQLKDRRA